jgi:hypothetical protein
VVHIVLDDSIASSPTAASLTSSPLQNRLECLQAAYLQAGNQRYRTAYRARLGIRWCGVWASVAVANAVTLVLSISILILKQRFERGAAKEVTGV